MGREEHTLLLVYFWSRMTIISKSIFLLCFSNLALAQQQQQLTWIERQGIQYRSKGEDVTFVVRGESRDGCWWNFMDVSGKECCYPSKNQLCAGVGQTHQCENHPNMAVATMQGRDRVCSLRINNLAAENTGKYQAFFPSPSGAGITVVLVVIVHTNVDIEEDDGFYDVDDEADNCWGWEDCAPDLLDRIDEQCEHCPKKDNLTSWREKEDVEFNVTCYQNSAVVNFNLEKMHEVGWMEGVKVERLLYKDGIVQDKAVIEDTRIKTLNVDRHITFADKICLEFTKDSIE